MTSNADATVKLTDLRENRAYTIYATGHNELGEGLKSETIAVATGFRGESQVYSATKILNLQPSPMASKWTCRAMPMPLPVDWTESPG